MAQQPKQYRIGDILETTGQKIAEIIGQSDAYGVYILDDSGIRWEYYEESKIPSRIKSSLRKFGELHSLSKRLFSNEERFNVKRALAISLWNAFNTPEDQSPIRSLTKVEKEILKQYKRESVVFYSLGALLAAVIASISIHSLTTFWGVGDRLIAYLLFTGWLEQSFHPCPEKLSHHARPAI